MATVQIAEKLLPILTKPKRLKIAVGGRGGSKSIGFADAFLKKCDDGERLCCGREFQNSIDDSVHSLLTARVDTLGIADFYSISAKDITSRSGGKIFYKGLARNPESIKSMQGVNTLWIEEAQTLSEKTIEVLFPTIRETDSEIWCSLNRGSSKDPFARRFLKPYEDHLKRHGFYEDDETLIVEINWQDNPWFPTVLQGERLRDKKNLPPARYEHIWEGAYSDTVDNAIIEPEWFDACIDAHIKLGFKPEGIEVVSHDAFDGGQDPAALAYRHGSVILDVQESDVFLSCLFGSEHGFRVSEPHHDFLSCLFGSEHSNAEHLADNFFLSCLFGSEPSFGGVMLFYFFLSCLFGSEQNKRLLP